MKPRLQFSLASLLWLMLCVACFFGGRYWDDVIDASKAQPKPIAIPPSATLTSLHLLAGGSATVSTKIACSRVLVADPSVVTIAPVASNQITVRARRTGSTEITIWDDWTGRTATYAVSVK
jgi:Flp pilus assembly secretin CpaC